jgi:hypothetical protein
MTIRIADLHVALEEALRRPTGRGPPTRRDGGGAAALDASDHLNVAVSVTPENAVEPRTNT